MPQQLNKGYCDQNVLCKQVYRGMMDLCVSKFKESEGLYVGPKEAGYCLLRSQLLMAFHDNAAYRSLANEVCCCNRRTNQETKG